MQNQLILRVVGAYILCIELIILNLNPLTFGDLFYDYFVAFREASHVHQFHKIMYIHIYIP